jgi:hypothetical protein
MKEFLLQAQVTLVPGNDLSICDIFVVMENLFTLLLLTASGVVALSLVIGDAMMLTSGGISSMMAKGMDVVKMALTGLVAVAASFIRLTTILTVFGVQGAFGPLVSFSQTSMDVVCN